MMKGKYCEKLLQQDIILYNHYKSKKTTEINFEHWELSRDADRIFQDAGKFFKVFSLQAVWIF